MMGKPTAISLLWAGLAALSASSPVAHASRADVTPSVDLGYEVHTGVLNVTQKYYLFSNVPYAEQPVGERRFKPSTLPLGSNSTVNDGSQLAICMQSAPEWLLAKNAALYNVTTDVVAKVLYNAAGQTEACLVLDIYVPQTVYDSRETSKAPVVVWIHGGGFISGSKAASTNAEGLLGRSMLNGNAGMVYVSINYRLGMFGWLGGAADTTPNLGLYDQALALSWVQKYIGLFGGDASRVTVMGESAGASSILHQITAYGGATKANFTRAILQSPAFQFSLNMTTSYQAVMTQAAQEMNRTISTVADLSKLDSSALKAINAAVVYNAPTAEFMFGPSPDGIYVPAIPQALLAEGKFDPDVIVMAGHNSYEALYSIANINSASDTERLSDTLVPDASDETKSYILDTLYPSSSYPSELLRAGQIATDSTFACSTRYLGTAFGNATYNYLFAIPPGHHAGDIPYTFYNGPTAQLDDGFPVNETMAHALQDYLVGFVLEGDPNQSPAKEVSDFPLYGGGAQVRALTADGLVTQTDDMANDRCAWWQQAFVQGLVLPAANGTLSTSTPSSNVPRSPASSQSPWKSKFTMAVVGASAVWPLVSL
ncbi:alpha/beta-hydrolase [Thozetella sp. PMI_491]|nr:alpha/beta-hydrolase [Thozetella sp. PMI_491]